MDEEFKNELIERISQLEAEIDNLVEPEVGGIWTDWTPTVDQNGTVAATVIYARYTVLNQVVHTQVRLDITGAGDAANPIIIASIPSAIVAANRGGDKYNLIGTAVVFNSVGSVAYHAGLLAVGDSDWRMINDGSANAVLGNSPSWALANGDIITFKATYER